MTGRADEGDARGRSGKPPWIGQDLLRLERFGAVHFQRSTRKTSLHPGHHARLLAAARHKSLLEAYAEEEKRRGPSMPERELAEVVARWRRDGVLDDGYRVRARLVDGRDSGVQLSAPLATHMQLTRACNLGCSHCYIPTDTGPDAEELGTDEV